MLMDFIEGLDKKDLKVYEEEIKKSVELEKKITPYLNFYQKELSEFQIKLYELFSEFIILFPDFDYMKRVSSNLNPKPYAIQYYYSKSSIINFCSKIPSYLTRTVKVFLKYAACRCIKTLLLRNCGQDNDNLFDFIDFSKKDTVYYDANEFNKKFIESITENSEIFPFFLQINSGTGINLITNKSTARFSMLNLEDVKNHLKITIPKYGIRVMTNSFFRGCSFTEVRIICVCETSIFGKPLDSSGLQSKNDFYYRKRYPIANLLQHESFGHIKFSLNFYAFNDKYNDILFSPLSPMVIYSPKFKEKMVEIVRKREVNGVKIETGESGIALEFFLTRGDKYLMNVMRGPKTTNYTELFNNPSLPASENLSTYIDILESINPYERKNYEIEIGPDIRFELNEDQPEIASGVPTIEKF